MTKKSLLGLLLSLSSIMMLLVSCEDTNGDNFNVDKESGRVQFSDSEQRNVVYGYTSSIEIPVSLFTNVNESGLDVYYELVDVVGTSSSVVNGSGTVRFAKGETEANIVLEISDSGISQEGVQFDVKLVSTNRDNVSIGAIPEHPIVKRVCLKTINLVSSYSGKTYIDGEFIADFTTTLTPTENANEFTISSAWGDTFVPAITGNPAHSSFTYPGIITLNVETGAIVLDGTESYSTQSNTGSVESCSGNITYRLGQSLFSGDPFNVDVVLTPNN